MKTNRILIPFVQRAALLLLGLSAFSLPLPAFSQGTAFTYQGRLTSGGAPARGIYDLRFTLYDAATNGQLLAGPVTNAAVNVTNGLFTTTVDFGNVFTGGSNWLALAVSTNGANAFTVLTPRQPLTPVPYAVMAGNASNVLGTVSASQVSGTLAATQLPATVITNGASGVNITGTFTGNGLGITNVDLGSVNTHGAILVTTNWGNFTLASSPFLGNSPSCVTATDVNGDGKVDLITANYSGNTLTVLTNNGRGGFVPASSPGVGIFPHSVTAADVNGDGKVDLITANYGNNTLTVLTNNGRGGFVLASSPFAGWSPFSVTAADVNGDGKMDLITANSGTNTLTVLTNNGRGGFILASSPGVGSSPLSVTAADVNGDGKVDLISANEGNNTLTVLTNNGRGGFVMASSPGVGSSPLSVTAADVNGNGKVDLISANFNDSTLTVLTNNGRGGFVMASSPVVGSNPYCVTAADVNGDGKVDLVSANSYGWSLSVLTNTSTVSGSFTGNGSGLTSLNAASLTGTVPAANFRPTVVTNFPTVVGPLPAHFTFTSHGGRLLITTDGSGSTVSAPAAIGMTVTLDSTLINTNRVWVNSNTHSAFVSRQMVVPAAAGTHTITLSAWNGTGTDFNDNYNVTVQELPY